MRQKERPLAVVVTWWDRKTFKHLYIMIQTKQLYEAPAAETLVVRFEGAILTGSITTQSKTMPSFIEDAEEDW